MSAISQSKPGFVGVLTIRLGALLVFSTALMAFLDVPLQGPAAPFGIVSFELAGSPKRALAILLQWQNDAALGHAKLSLASDFLYLAIYAGFFAVLARWVGVRLGEAVWSARAIRASIAAAVFDMLENGVLLFEVMQFSSPSPYPQVAMSFAIAKFAFVGASALYGIWGAISVFRRR